MKKIEENKQNTKRTKETKSKFIRAKDPIKQILDDNDTDNVILFDAENKPIEFEQIARIQIDGSDDIFVILIPVTKIDGIEEGEGVVFKLDVEKGNLDTVEDQKLIDKVLDAYVKLTEGD